MPAAVVTDIRRDEEIAVGEIEHFPGHFVQVEGLENGCPPSSAARAADR